MNLDWTLLAGPAALAIAASLACVALWRDHQKDDDLKDETMRTLSLTVAQYPESLRNLTTVVLDAAERQRSRPRTERADDR